MPSARARTRLIAELASLLHDGHLPEDARCASLTLIGWLARRMPGEAASTDGVEHARRQLLALGVCRQPLPRPPPSSRRTSAPLIGRPRHGGRAH